MRVLIIIFIFFVVLMSNTRDSSAQQWQTTLESSFSVVETFDGYDDWTGKAPDGFCGNDRPIMSVDGSLSNLIQKHCYYARGSWSTKPRPLAIRDHGNNKRVTGKSFRLSATGKGPTRGNNEISGVKVFVGTEGDETSGYNPMYLFFRMRLSSTAFPTYSWDDGNNHDKECHTLNAQGYVIPCYVSGKDYVQLNSWKWVAINAGFVNGEQFTEENRAVNACRWGISEVHSHIKTKAYERRVTIAPRRQITFGNVNIIPYLDKLIGVEIYIKKESTLDASDGVYIVWFYDGNGIPTEVLNLSNVNFFPSKTGPYGNSSCWGKYDELSDPAVSGDPGKIITKAEVESFKWNRISFEGNKRITATNGTGGNNYSGGVIRNLSGNIIGDMETDWYMDDLIVDNARIGPKYYGILNPSAADTISPGPPAPVDAK